MQQPLLIGLVAGLFALTTAILTLIGVLVATKANFKLGKRTGDVQQQSADTTRIAQLVAETQALRKEISDLWAANKDLRHQFEMAEARHESEQQTWIAEKRTLCDKHNAEKSAMTDRFAAEMRTLTAESECLKVETKDLKHQFADTATQLGRAQADLAAALLAQAQAQGGLDSARETIQTIASPPQTIPVPTATH